jgi:hypothetical protein
MDTRAHVIASRFLGVGLFLIFALQAQAGFIGYYDPANFTLVNTQADGFVTTPGDGSSITLTGGNDGSGFFGTTDFVIIAPQTGIVTFRYLFTTLDVDQFGGVYDDAGFLTNDQFTPFSQLLSPDPVFAFFPVFAGDTFGFRVETGDNLGEPGILTISDFTAPQPVEAPVPEPSLGIIVFLGIAAGAVWQWRQTRRKETV